jgi:hypothetical protein
VRTQHRSVLTSHEPLATGVFGAVPYRKNFVDLEFQHMTEPLRDRCTLFTRWAGNCSTPSDPTNRLLTMDRTSRAGNLGDVELG